jgi:predicted PolB exonuclease-like 3'-5' exonuclease
VLIFDIETGPLPDERLETLFTFDPPPQPAAFDPSSVKYGNLKDEAKRAAKLEEAMSAHAQSVIDYPTLVDEARAVAWEKFKGDAALSAVTGQVLAIGVMNTAKGTKTILHGSGQESTLLAEWWSFYKKRRNERFAGLNILGFDLPFLIRRSWLNQVEVPAAVADFSGKWVNFDKQFVDLRNVWLLGQSWGQCESSLDHIAKALGLNGKMGGEVTGASFAQYWNGTPEEHELACVYLLNDLIETKNIAARLGYV